MRHEKIRIADVESARRELEQVPESEVQEITKREAVRMLLEVIRAAQAKGHRVEAIASILSQKGIPVSAALLKSYLSHAGARGSAKRNKRKQAAGASRRNEQGARGSPTAAARRPEEALLETSSATATGSEPGAVAGANRPATRVHSSVLTGIGQEIPVEPSAPPLTTAERSGGDEPVALAKEARGNPKGRDSTARELSATAPPEAILRDKGEANIGGGPGGPVGGAPAVKRGSAFVPRRDSEDI